MLDAGAERLGREQNRPVWRGDSAHYGYGTDDVSEVGGPTTVANTSAVIGCWGVFFVTHPVVWPDDDGPLVASVQSYLQCLATKQPVPTELLQAWESFYRQYQPLVRRIVAASSWHAASDAERDDFSQEVWGEIVLKLPRLVYSSVQGRLASWLAVLARRKVHGLARLQLRTRASRPHAIDGLEKSLPSQQPGPEELCCLKETRGQLDSALAKLKARTSRKSYEVFRLRFIEGQSAQEVGASLDLTPDEVRYRHYRVMQKWRKLTDVNAFREGLGSSSAHHHHRRLSRVSL